MLEVGTEKMKIDDEQNGEALGNIDPKQPFHRMGLTGRTHKRQESVDAIHGVQATFRTKCFGSAMRPRIALDRGAVV